MTLIKPIASLTADLLARKGFARPAADSEAGRSPLQPDRNDDSDADGHSADDLGWNDLRDAEIAAILQQVQRPLSVLSQQEAIARMICAPPASRRPRGIALSQGRLAAFTLRLDADRHTALRLACRLTNQSAQNLLIAALDRLLSDMSEVAALAPHLPGQKREHISRGAAPQHHGAKT